mgnify:CR=1 FL=1
MKVRVTMPFIDKYTGTVYQKDQEIEVSKERFEELVLTALGPFAEEIKPPDPPPARTAKEGKKQEQKPKKQPAKNKAKSG